jgi:hypothetical protein
MPAGAGMTFVAVPYVNVSAFGLKPVTADQLQCLKDAKAEGNASRTGLSFNKRLRLSIRHQASSETVEGH